MFTVYAYKSCETCRKALRWLKENEVPHEVRAIRETPPSHGELKRAAGATGGDLRRLFNTSGADYRELGLKDMLPTMKPSAAIELLATRGNLVKRPFLIGPEVILIGFREEEWRQAFGR